MFLLKGRLQMMNSTTTQSNQLASCLQENLARALNIVAPAVATRSTLPVLSHVLLFAENGQLKITATNLDLTVICQIGAIADGEWGIAVPAREFGDLIASLPKERVDLKFIRAMQSLNIRCQHASANVKGIAAGEFPTPPTAANAIQITLDAETLHQMIRQTTFSASSDDARPILKGVLTEISQVGIAFASADGFRLSVRSVSQPLGITESLQVVIPASTLNLVAKVAAQQEEPVEIALDEKRTHAFFRQGNVQVISSLIDGNFPNVRQIVPQQHTTRVVTNAADLLAAVKRSIVFARSEKGIVRLHTVSANGAASKPSAPNTTPALAEGAKGKLVVSATAKERGDYTDELDATVEGNPIEIAFNGQFLTELIEKVDPAQIILEMTSDVSPGVFKVVGREDYVHVVMPMHAK
jgi:DNA polymerase III subunit beta